MPTSADGLLAGKVLYRLLQKRKKKAGGKSAIGEAPDGQYFFLFFYDGEMPEW